MNMKHVVFCFLLTGFLSTLVSCATDENPSVHHDSAVRKMADEEFDSRLAY